MSFNPRTGPKKLQSTTSQSNGFSDVFDLLYYLLDLSSTINRLFSVYSDGKQIFFDENFHKTQVCSIYQ